MSAVAEHLWACPVCHARWEQHQLPAEFPGPGCPVESAYCHLVAAPGRSVAVRANYSVVSVDGVIRVRDLRTHPRRVSNTRVARVRLPLRAERLIEVRTAPCGAEELGDPTDRGARYWAFSEGRTPVAGGVPRVDGFALGVRGRTFGPAAVAVREIRTLRKTG
jgi:hypothetical protein